MRDEKGRKHLRKEKHAEGKPHWKEGIHPGEMGHKSKGKRPPGAKTFRRGRAIEFLDRMNLKRATLKKQLETSELQTIHPVLVGELKAVESIIDEFVHLFDIHQNEIKLIGDAEVEEPTQEEAKEVNSTTEDREES